MGDISSGLMDCKLITINGEKSGRVGIGDVSSSLMVANSLILMEESLVW